MPAPQDTKTAAPTPQDKKDKKEDLTDEDQALKDNIDIWVEAFLQGDAEALRKLDSEIRTATGSMTSLPKPYKFLLTHYTTLAEFFEGYTGQDRPFLADLLSLISMTLADPYTGQGLTFLRQGTGCDFTTWGEEFQLQLAGDVTSEYQAKLEKGESAEETIVYAKKLLAYFKEKGSVIDACDLLMEIEQLPLLDDLVDSHNVRRIYDYLIASSPHASDNDEYLKILKTAHRVALKTKEYPYALRVALKLDDQELITSTFNSCEDELVKMQMAIALGRQRQVVETEDEKLTELMSNTMLSEFYGKLVEDLDLATPKTPADIYKAHLDEDDNQVMMESALSNLADTYVNAFVNIGTGKDTLMQKDEPWIASVQKEGILAATASLGLIYLWDVDACTDVISDYLDVKDGYAKGGACMGLGMASSGIWSDSDTAKGLLEDFLTSDDASVQLGSAVGLGLAYAGTAREDFLEEEGLMYLISDLNIGPDVAGFAAVSLGLIFVSKSNEELINTVLSSLMERSEEELNQTSSRFFGVSLALNYLGQQDTCEAAVETLQSIEHPLGRFAEICVEAAAYIGSGNVLKIQEFLKVATPHETDPQKTLAQEMAVIGIALIANSEEVGNKMANRALHHIFQYCELPVKRAVPIAMALLNISNPQLSAIDMLTKLAYNADAEMSRRAIFGMGLIGLGTNNARIAGILRSLAVYYSKDPGHRYVVRISQGLLSAGKGTVTANPFYSDGFLYSKVSMAGLFIMAVAMLDTENNIVGKFNFTLYYLVCAIYPRMLFTIDENLENFPTQVRVGQAVDTVTLVGNPRAITGFQTHKSPVVLQYGDRAEVAEEEWMPVGNVVLENFVIVKKNPEFAVEVKKPRKKTSVSIYF